MWSFVCDSEKSSTDRRKSVAGVGDEHASLANGTVTHSDTLDEPGRTHCYSMFIFLEDKPWLMMIHEAIVQCMLCWRRKKTRELVCVLEKGEKRNWIWSIGASQGRSDLIHVTSAVANAKLWYSASVLDLATTDCFLDHQDTRLDPKKMAAPEVDLLSSGSDAQWAS